VSPHVREQLLKRLAGSTRPMAVARAAVPCATLRELEEAREGLAARAPSAERKEALDALAAITAALTTGSADDIQRLVTKVEWTRCAADWAIANANLDLVTALEVASERADDGDYSRDAAATAASAAARIRLAQRDLVAAHRNAEKARALTANESILALASSRGDPARNIVNEARALSRDGEPGKALALLRWALVHMGDDERLWVSAATIEGSTFNTIAKDVREAIVAALPTSENAVASIGSIFRFCSYEELGELLERVREVEGASQSRAKTILTRAINALGPAPTDAAIDRWVTDRVAVQYAAAWAIRNARWELSERIEQAVLRVDRFRQDEKEDPIAWALFHAGQVRQARGDFAGARRLASRALARAEVEQFKNLLVIASTEEDIALHGWPKARLRRDTPRRAPGPGSVGYVLHSSLPYNTVGYATRSGDIAAQLIADGWPVHCVTRPGYPLVAPEGRSVSRAAIPITQSLDGSPYTRLPLGESRLQLAKVDHHARELVKLDEAHHWQILHAASNAPNGIAAIQAANQLGIPSIYEVRGLWHLTRAARFPGFEHTQQFTMLERLEVDACHAADRVLTLTDSLKSILVNQGIAADKITVVPNGVDLDAVEIAVPDPAVARQLGIDGKVVIGYIGSLLHYEGLDVLMMAFARVLAEGANAALLIVGDGDASRPLEALAHDLGIDAAVRFIGRVDRRTAMAYYAQVDIAPFPRLSFPVTETVSPLKPFEAMAWSKAVVTSDVAPLREIIDHGATGLVTAAGDVDSLAEALSSLIADRALRKRLGDGGRAWVGEHRTWSILAKRIGEVYSELGAMREA